MPMNSAEKMFRKSAVDRLASPEQLDELITVTDARGWIAAAGVGVLAVGLVVWGVLGSIPTEVPAQGIFVMEGGRVVGAISPGAGVITQLSVKAGDLVKQGQPVATIRQSGTEVKLTNARQVEIERTAALATRGAALDREAQALKVNADQRRAAQQQVIDQTAARIERLQAQLKIREQMRAQNLTPEERVEESRGELARAQQDLSAARARRVEIDSEVLHSKLDADRELATLQQAVSDAKRNIAELSASLNDARDVLAPATGRVTELTVSEGQLIKADTLVMNVESEGRRLQAVVYVPTEQGKRVTVGMKVRIAPSIVKKEEWGTLIGRVSAISDFPATPQGMAAVLQNSQLVQAFGGGSPPYEARIDLEPAQTPTGYAWSSGQGPVLDLTSGTTLKADIAVREEPPVNLILPFFRQATGAAR